MKLSATVATLSILAGCGGAAKAPAVVDSPTQRDGRYMFSANVFGQGVGGAFQFTGDTAVLVGDSPACALVQFTIAEFWVRCRTYAPQGSGAGERSRGDAGVLLKFDRHHPALATWTSSITVEQTRRVCERYDTSTGRQVCASWKNETVYSSETKSGHVSVRRTP